ncbi:MAG TPA: hypothetical protein VFA70_12730, partial [Dehalococcoidia bacterium]|nr:hypothetical protein [Dehalococcoidia bacterium]
EGRLLEHDTYVQERGPEAGVPHHYCDEADVRAHLAAFAIAALRLDEREEDGERHCHWEALARVR